MGSMQLIMNVLQGVHSPIGYDTKTRSQEGRPPSPKQLKEQIQPPPREERSKEGRGGKGLKLNPPGFVIIQVLILPKGLLTST